MKHINRIVLTLAIIALSAAPVFAKPHGGEGALGQGGKGHRNLEMLKLALDLTPQQQEDIQRVVAESRENSSELREKVHANKTALRDVMDENILNESQLEALLQEKTRLHKEMMIERHTTKAKINELLTPQQQSKHQELRQSRMERRGHKRFAQGRDI